MRIDILTIFPQVFKETLNYSILKRAQEKGLVTIQVWDIRQFAQDKHKSTDDYPFGGGGGMIMKPEPLFAAVEAVLKSKHETQVPDLESRIILLSPQGRLFNQKIAAELAKEKHLIFICGHYEGVDERIREHLATDEISIGDYILTGGELAALVVIDALVRLIPGVLGNLESAQKDSFSDGLLEYPQYTRPADFRGWKVPEILLSGNHEKIRRWRREQSLRRTLLRRPDLLAQANLSEEDKALLEKIKSGE